MDKYLTRDDLRKHAAISAMLRPVNEYALRQQEVRVVTGNWDYSTDPIPSGLHIQ